MPLLPPLPLPPGPPRGIVSVHLRSAIRKPSYSGDREQFREFMTQLHLVFGSDPRRYANDQSKLTYAASFLRGAAKRWQQRHPVQLVGCPVVQSYIPANSMPT